ncbi:MAG TPA: DMT family transporter [Clostridia bacterium]|nr:DMT family transporter [Clostridia bacterium]
MKRERTKAIIALVIAAVLWSTGGMLIKLIDWNPVAIAGTRSGISAILMFFYILLFRKDIKPRRILTKGKFKWAGAIVYALTVIGFVVANKLTAAANVIFLQYTAPIWVALLSGWLLKERVSKFDWTIIMIVIAGMGLFFVGDIQKGHMLGNFLSVLTGLFLAGVVLMLKMQKNSTAIEMTFLGNLLTFVVSLPFIIGPIPDLQSIVGLILLGVFQLGIAYILFSEAVLHVTALEAILIPVIEPLLSPIWVFLMIGEKPSFFAIIGGLIVLAAVVFRSVVTGRRNKIKKLA